MSVVAQTVDVGWAAIVVLLAAGVDWDPTGYGPGTWALPGGLGAAYAAVSAVPLFLFAVVLALPT